MTKADEAENEGDMDAGDERDQAGIAAEIALELMEGTQAFLGLGHKLWVALEGAEAHGIVDIGSHLQRPLRHAGRCPQTPSRVRWHFL